MKSLKIETSPSTHGVYFQAISKAINQRGMTQHKEEEELISPVDLTEPNTIYKFTDTCKLCNRLLCFEEIMEGFKKNFYDNTTRCIQCGSDFVVRFQWIKYEDECPQESAMYELYSPLNILRELENLIKSKGETYIFTEYLEKSNPNFYQSIILYMRLIKAPSFFISRVIVKKYIKIL